MKLQKKRCFSNLLAATTVCMSILCAPSAFGDDVFHYTVRGVVRALPGGGRAKNEILIKHEPIPEYRDETGAKVGMGAMTMPFYLGSNVSIDGIKVGDTVEFALESVIRPTFTEKVTAIKKIE